MYEFTCFDTALGRCAIAWGPRGIVAVALPEGDDGATRRRIGRGFPGAVEARAPDDVADAVAAIVRLFDGRPEELGDVRLDMTGVPEFHRRVYEAARAIPPGETRSYGELAVRVGEPRAAQAVGRALGRNRFPIVVPCHRVLASDGSLHGFSAPGGTATKRRMLEIEGALAPALFH